MYRKVMIGTAVGAATATAGYTVAITMALAESVQLPQRIGAICLTLILGLSLASYTAWLLQRAHIERNPDAIADAVIDRLADRLTAAISESAARSHSRTVAALREIVTSELVIEQLNAAVARAHRYGMVTEAQGRANVAALPRRT